MVGPPNPSGHSSGSSPSGSQSLSAQTSYASSNLFATSAPFAAQTGSSISGTGVFGAPQASSPFASTTAVGASSSSPAFPVSSPSGDIDWKQSIRNLIKSLNDQPFDSDLFIKIYTTMYNMCIQMPPHDYSVPIYNSYRLAIKDYLKEKVLPTLKMKDGESMLKELVIRWNNHKAMVNSLSRVFSYIERNYISWSSLPTLKEVGMTCFRDVVFIEMQSKAREAAIALIHEERHKPLLKNVLDVYIENGMGLMEEYKDDFESFMLQETTSNYSCMALTWMEKYTWPVYMRMCEEFLKKERERVGHCLQSNTEPKLIEILQNELLVVVAKQLIENEESGFCALLKEDKTDDVSRMYRLYHKIPQGLSIIANLFQEHVSANAAVLISQAKMADTDQGLIGEVVELHDKYVTECFQNHTRFHEAFVDAFKFVCNEKVAGSSIEELLATYCDSVLKKGESDVAMEAKVEKAFKLLACIPDKKLFIAFYREKLARRLLIDRIGEEDHEKSLLAKLRTHIGQDLDDFLVMYSMVRDMALSRDYHSRFREYLTIGSDSNPGIDLTVSVISGRGDWPRYERHALTLSREMDECLQVFNDFYNSGAEEKKLSWIHSQGTCHIVGNFDQGSINLIVSSSQAAVLSLFNDAARLSYAEIADKLNLQDKDLDLLLHSVSCGKYKILRKEPISGTISRTDVFEFDSKFTNELHEIQIPRPSDVKEVVAETNMRDAVDAVDAALVRIMKRRGELEDGQLVLDCIEYLAGKFTPDIDTIMRRIVHLIKIGYMVWDNEHQHMLIYE